jgi:hypothetical protein
MTHKVADDYYYYYYYYYKVIPWIASSKSSDQKRLACGAFLNLLIVLIDLRFHETFFHFHLPEWLYFSEIGFPMIMS